MKTININGSEYTVEQLSKILEEAKKKSPMDEVYKYHNTTEDQFEKDYFNIPLHLKYYQKEVMIVAFYNKGWKPNMKDKNERKYYNWYYNDPFRFHSVFDLYVYSDVPSALLLQKEEYGKEIAEKFKKEIEQSRLTM